jgi:ATP-dependent HslUV protease subunit HslV
MPDIRSTTILAVRHQGHVVMVGDGQVTVGSTVVKGTAAKVRRLAQGTVLAGFAGSAADAMALSDKFEDKLRDFNRNLTRAAVELAKEWRTDRVLRRLDAMLIVCDTERTLVLSGGGDVIEPDDGVASIGSGSSFALAAARALMRHAPAMQARDIAESAMRIASEICVYTNDRFVVEALPGGAGGESKGAR